MVSELRGDLDPDCVLARARKYGHCVSSSLGELNYRGYITLVFRNGSRSNSEDLA